MSDVFLSYSRADRDIAQRLATCLEKENLTVWWDPKILPGSDSMDILKKQLEIACCVVVLWSSESVESRWVKEEAHYGTDKRKLIPVLIENVEPPFGFGSIEAADLCQVRQFDGHPEFINLLQAIRAKQSGDFSYKTPIFKPPGTFGGGVTGSAGSAKKLGYYGLFQATKSVGIDAGSGVIFEDHFEDNSNKWLEKRDHQEIVMRVIKGKYSINHKLDTGRYYSWMSIPIFKSKDFEIEVEIAHLFSISKYDKDKIPFYGVNWGGAGGNNFHEIQFSYDGQFCYKQVIDGKWFTVIPWKKTYRFNELDDHDLRSVNKIQIIKKAEVIEFRLNGSWLEDADFATLYGDNIGFSVHKILEIEVNHIKVTQS